MTRPDSPPVTRRRVLRGLLGGGAALGALGGVGAAQAYAFGVTREQASLPGLRSPLRAAFLTDLHYGLYVGPGSVRAWVDAANAERPDLVLLGGDLLDLPSGDSPAALFPELARLRAPLGVYGVWGNHDYDSFGRRDSRRGGRARPDWEERREQLTADFARAGVTLLVNTGRAVRDDLWLGGVNDFWQRDADPAAALAGAGDRATLLLTHNPDVLPELPAHVGLTLCGHTHGGQIRLPLVGAVHVPSRYGQRYAMGWVRGAFGSPAYVSRGLGTSGVPIRNLCAPEVTVLTLTGAG
ncbi:metallophosphoesterase [Deinococcus aestuarii]|uniref:metallophosphoesterase n=1 Tax=Deinococcus aestuarii TaxID=2774531 RepID=UPI001C0C31B4|nr:metallophosphoesterase [Deinococcus aestuarii]